MSVVIACLLVGMVAISIGYPFLLKEYDPEYREHIENTLEQTIQASRKR